MKPSERFVPDLLRPKWRCARCGKTYWRNRRTCRNCEATVFERVR
ncbi:SprT family zinc-dependent metalloprotease [Halomicrococcus gelatinilyticus]